MDFEFSLTPSRLAPVPLIHSFTAGYGSITDTVPTIKTIVSPAKVPLNQDDSNPLGLHETVRQDSQPLDLDAVTSISIHTSGILVQSDHAAILNLDADEDMKSTRSNVSIKSLKSAMTDTTAAESKRPMYSTAMARACLGTLIIVNAVARGVLAIVEAVGTPLFITVALTSSDGVKAHNAARVCEVSG
jgi:hypothetical protein